jgi:hypothetical protein
VTSSFTSVKLGTKFTFGVEMLMHP